MRSAFSLLVLALFIISACQAPAEESEPAESPESSASAAPAAASPSPAPEGARSYIISPSDGAVVTSPVTVVFGLEGMGVAPAGIQVEGTGHHHLMVDVAAMPDLSQPLPSDANHIHFGKGQTQAVLELEPGEHTLQLILGDWAHTPHSPPVVSEKVTITVTSGM